MIDENEESDIATKALTHSDTHTVTRAYLCYESIYIFKLNLIVKSTGSHAAK